MWYLMDDCNNLLKSLPWHLFFMHKLAIEINLKAIRGKTG
jgi:hypothetical protein